MNYIVVSYGNDHLVARYWPDGEAAVIASGMSYDHAKRIAGLLNAEEDA